ncbi:hypothetical protein C8A01DRAFT_37881 [Parachaetomium inaequale]|uniref:C2H2-type domain-containing protein n=1 Tax=Parachaetomium inaequale TaxID=2588326 RepID=A0AAN6PF88_9PEZI|nr:hypothetical protein C8A01DRAFT_37881 [Parachaetomium inaequale]
MASRSSGTPPPPPPPPRSATTTTNRESFLSRKKKEIVDKSMAFFQLSLDRCLDNSVSSAPAAGPAAAAAAAGVAGRRRVKRGREEDDDVDESGGAGVVQGADKAKKKKVNPKEKEGNGGKKFACPFCKHDPVKYRKTKTCCGPGWDDVHRVKEHVYRRHSLKNFCPRCFEHFDKPDLLKKHQRADVPCKLREKSPGGITEEQEKQLRMRAKSNCSEEDRWEEMYRSIFPGEKVPSPYYDSESDSPSSKSAKSQFQNLAEAKEFLRVEIPRLVQPEIEKYVNTLFEEVQEKVNQKTVEIIRNVETKVLRTFHFQEEQASALPSAAASFVLLAQGGIMAEPSPPPSPNDTNNNNNNNNNGSSSTAPELSKISQFFDEYKDDAFVSELCGSLNFDLEHLLAAESAQGFGGGCEGFSQEDSAYFTSSSSGGGQGSFGASAMGGYVQRYH